MCDHTWINIPEGTQVPGPRLPSDLWDPTIKGRVISHLDTGLARIREAGDNVFVEFTCSASDILQAVKAWLKSGSAHIDPLRYICFRNVRTQDAWRVNAGEITNPKPPSRYKKELVPYPQHAYHYREIIDPTVPKRSK